MIENSATGNDIELLRQIADNGLRWFVGSRKPTIPRADSSIQDVEPEWVSKFIKDGLLCSSLQDGDSSHPHIEYSLTSKGIETVISSFKGLKHAAIAVYMESQTLPDGEASINQEAFFRS